MMDRGDGPFDSNVRGEDFEWYPADRSGHIAFLTTAGWGPVPLPTFRSARQYAHSADYFEDLPERCETRHSLRDAHVDSWIEAGRRGLFVYDYEIGPRYSRVVVPHSPLSLGELPAAVREWLEAIRFEALDFAENETLFPQQAFACAGPF